MDKIYNMVEIETIEALAKIVKDNDLGEITLVDGGKTITVKGKKCSPPPPMMMGGMPQMAMPAVLNEVSVSANAAPAAPKALDGNVVKAPIVGTFYSASAPDKPPFVSVGQSVKKGDVLMIIESMKLMNEVQSEFDGVVTDILVKNAEAVEFDQPIMVIK